MSYGVNTNGDKRYFSTATPSSTNNNGVIDLLKFAESSVSLTSNENSIEVTLSTLVESNISYTLSTDDKQGGWLSARTSTGEDVDIQQIKLPFQPT